MRVAGGPKACAYGCMGLGSCVKACAFDAIHIVDALPRSIPISAYLRQVYCGLPEEADQPGAGVQEGARQLRQQGQGPEVMKVCSNGCIGCKMCEKACKFDAIHVVDGVAKIDYDKCKNCKMCAKACPKGCIEPVPTEEEKAKFKEMQQSRLLLPRLRPEAEKAAAAPAAEDK